MSVARLFALGFVFFVTTMAWMVLGGVTAGRSMNQSDSLSSRVTELWGSPLRQEAPVVAVRWTETVTRVESWTDDQGNSRQREIVAQEVQERAEPFSASRLVVGLHQDIRRKGLVWFPLYDVDFDGGWTWAHTGSETGTVRFTWAFPESDGFYDDFHVLLNGKEVAATLHPELGQAWLEVPVKPGDSFTYAVRFRSRGTTSWTYQPTSGVGELTDFDLRMTTDFAAIDYPTGTLSPTDREVRQDGATLAWTFSRMISGKGIGMIVPCPVQPGELAAAMAFSAPFSLAMFMLWIVVLGLLRGIDVHPVNHAFLAASFFAFHLLFGYTADRIAVEWAFALSSVVSVLLVVSYLYRVVSPRFAVVEAGGAQLIYLVGFAAAHFQDGATGLTLTVIGILTLFALMQLTSHVRWGEVFGGGPRQPTTA